MKIDSLSKAFLVFFCSMMIGFITSGPQTVKANGLKRFNKAHKKTGSFCFPVSAKIKTNWSIEDCESPIGSCTVGTIKKGGFLDGTSSYTATSMAYAAGMPEVEEDSTLSYAGILTITTKHGTLTLSDVGIMESTNNVFSELNRVEEGTGKFEGATGILFMFGDVTPTGFDGKINGNLCLSN